MQMFSVNAASLLLERDRRTVTKALLGVKPDATVKGQARWSMRTIVDALAAQERPAASSDAGTGNSIAPGLAADYAAFDLKFAAMEAAPTLEKRRALAVKLGPLVIGIDRQLRATGRANGVGDELADYRAQHIFRLTVIGFQQPCVWSYEKACTELRC
jgi:hypothetical protein